MLAACDEKRTSLVFMQTEQNQSTMLEFMGVNLYGVEGPGPTHNLGGGAQPLTGPHQYCQVNEHIFDSLDLKLLAEEFI